MLLPVLQVPSPITLLLRCPNFLFYLPPVVPAPIAEALRYSNRNIGSSFVDISTVPILVILMKYILEEQEDGSIDEYQSDFRKLRSGMNIF